MTGTDNKKSAIGSTALDRLIPKSSTPPAESPTPVEQAKVVISKPSKAKKVKKAAATKTKKSPKTLKKAKIVKIEPAEKVRFTVLISRQIVERLRDAVVHTPGGTLADAAEAALEAWLAKKSKEFGGKIPSRGKTAVKSGRPIR
jgi:hypothetical protein